MQGGIPPHMVPMIFAGIGGANLANFSLEVLQQYTAQLQAAQQQVQAGQEDARERRSINQPPAPPHHRWLLIRQLSPPFNRHHRQVDEVLERLGHPWLNPPCLV
ncbi:hypothetical protein KCU95_g20234, partial [Aureobasidium melanogenum]